MDPERNLLLLSNLDPKQTRDALDGLTHDQHMELLSLGQNLVMNNIAKVSKDESERIISLLIMIGMFIGRDLGDRL
jgi:hypothetical protein